MRLRLARHPKRLQATHSIVIDEFLALEAAGQQDAVSTMIKMLGDLHATGRDSPYLVRLTGLPLWELKPTARGGVKGGSRVYLFLAHGDAGIVNCEVKPGVVTSTAKLEIALEVLVAYKQGIPVFRGA